MSQDHHDAEPQGSINVERKLEHSDKSRLEEQERAVIAYKL